MASALLPPQCPQRCLSEALSRSRAHHQPDSTGTPRNAHAHSCLCLSPTTSFLLPSCLRVFAPGSSLSRGPSEAHPFSPFPCGSRLFRAPQLEALPPPVIPREGLPFMRFRPSPRSEVISPIAVSPYFLFASLDHDTIPLRFGVPCTFLKFVPPPQCLKQTYHTAGAQWILVKRMNNRKPNSEGQPPSWHG